MAVSPLDLYVSPEGGDNNPGTALLPFRTLAKARDAVRQLASISPSDFAVHVGSGDYFLSEPLVFDERDSGVSGHRVTYSSTVLGGAQLIGGEKIISWEPYKGSIYRSFIGKNRVVTTLIEDDARATIARFPNASADPDYPAAKVPYLAAEKADGSRMILHYRAEDFDPRAWGISPKQIFLWSGGAWQWFADQIPIDYIDADSREIHLKYPSRYPIYQVDRGSRYFLQGTLDFLDQPGEFFYDTDSGYIYYWPRGEISNAAIILPTIKTIVSFEGSDPTHAVHDVTFEGFTIKDSAFTDWYRFGWINEGDSGESHIDPTYDRQIDLPQHRTGMVFLHNTTRIAIKDNHLLNSGYSALYMLFDNQSNQLTGNWIEHSGHGGILVQGPYPGEGDITRNHTITNNLIQVVGELLGHSSGISVSNSGGNEVSHNEVSTGPRIGVIFTGNPETTAESYARNNHLAYLKITGVMQDSNDGAALYGWGFGGQKNTIEQVLIDRVFHHPSAAGILPFGVYMDNESRGQVIRSVKVTNVEGPPFFSREEDPQMLDNVSWESFFREDLMDYSNIGLTADFRWPRPSQTRK